MSSDNKQLIAFRRIVWNIPNFYKIFYKNEQSKAFNIQIGSVTTTWNFILSYCVTLYSNWITMTIRESSQLLTDKISVKARIKTPWLQNQQAPDLFWNLTKKSYETKLIISDNPKFLKLKNNCLILEVELTLTINEDDLCKKLVTNNVADGDRKPTHPNDFTLICSDDSKVEVNKEALSKQSPVFKAMFESDMVEKKTHMAQITDIDSSTMRQLIDFLYTGSVDLYMGAAVKNLLYAAEKYEMIELKNECQNVLMTQITDENVFDTLEIADLYRLRRVECKCLVFIVKNYKTFSKSEHWKQFANLDISLITKTTDALASFNTTLVMN